MSQQIFYDTVSEATKGLTQRGYTTDLKVLAENECLVCQSTSKQLSPDEFVIDEVHRFEGDTDPSDEMIVYAISSMHHDIKGILVNAYGVDADTSTFQIIKHLNTHL
ncbi:phosphoribosylpyrophosphate synthetase [Reichenbachiella carrageenanivorans]|uniref:Phosphoribosylpyrophosphate synthetase n=1 Tax=Reichenbachiella carrageenanivorans TaxID=2979869 RepID=A0ABY6D5C5_9BACT|nr:phosphoribosylpyrophosphate synthetase [Reichenbachiella carrageenanivorans]UXX79040.1 phosphoribosylpyrophosphate synthetase [Reichenbachiella carrageenanivorans]